MVQENINPLRQKIKSDFGRWTKIHLSLREKYTIKIMSAPVIYYILSLLPLNIPESYFRDFDTLILDFPWVNSHHRLGIKKLQAHTKRRGFSLPNFRWYCWAFSMKHIRTWKPNDEAGDNRC